jgi:small redox-active disulfide protein 2
MTTGAGKALYQESKLMTDKDITQVRIGQYGFGIIGIKRLMAELAENYADKSDAEVAVVMVERLSKDNYIPANVREDYGRAFVREFRKFLGQPYTEDAAAGLDIKVLGMGCPQCHALTQTIMELLTELQLPAGLDHVTDIKEIARYGVMGSPALLINGKIMAVGSIPPKEKIKKWLAEASPSLGKK